MQAEIISIGTELLLGEIVDSNSAHIARTLRDIGLDIYMMTTVGDNEQRTAEAVRIALERANIVITTGGLGPTVDDITRQAIATATGRPLEFRQDLLDQIADRFQRFGVKMKDNNRQQAYIPQGAIAIENPVGTAPIFIVDQPGDEARIVIVLPGVPREMKYLLDEAVVPWLQTRLNLQETLIKALVLRTAGIGESTIDDAIGDLMKTSNPTVGLAAHTGQTDIRITAKAATEEEADALIESVEQELRQRLGEFIYGTGDLPIEDAIIELCMQSGTTLAACEVATDGTLAVRLDEADPSRLVFNGGYATGSENELAMHLPVNTQAPVTQAAEEAARLTREDKQTTLGLAIIARPLREDMEEGMGGIALAVASEDGVKSRYYAFDERRLEANNFAVAQVLAMARRQILKSD